MENTGSEVNILLLGQSGVGKSSFINGLLSYLSYSTFNEAKESELKFAIPAKFVIHDENNVMRTIEIGSEENESNSVGESATQYPAAHVFYIEDTKIRVIDTPGIGDTRGWDIDRQNVQNIFEFVSRYDHLNAICILLKPNEARSGLLFRCCMKELLTRLHRKAADNVVFCFTNSRCTFYRPGDTMSALQQLLRDVEERSGVKIPVNNNVFCFDSESFRFLAAIKAGVNFEDDDRTQFSQSWSRSVTESQLLIQHIVNCPIHNMKETLILNESRCVFNALALILAETSQLIQCNETVTDNLKKDLNECEMSIEELATRLNIMQIDLEPVFLELYPRLVCTHNDCVQVVTLNNIQKVNYVSKCHPQCELNNVMTDTVNDVSIQSCQVMSNGTCIVCGHHWSVHMVVNYGYKNVERFEKDVNVAEALNSKNVKVELLKQQIQDSEALNAELNEEQKLITETSAKFAHFTKVNAIAVFNDDLENYLDHMIKEEQGKLNAGYNNGSVIDGLLKTKASYKQQQKIFNDAAVGANSDQNVQLDEIRPMIDNLYKLKHNGGKLNSFLQANKCIDSNSSEKEHNLGSQNNTKFLRNFGNRFAGIFKKTF